MKDQSLDDWTPASAIKRAALVRLCVSSYNCSYNSEWVYKHCTTNFHSSSVGLAYCNRRYCPRRWKSNRQIQGQLWPETDMFIQCILYKWTILPWFIFAHLLFLSVSEFRLGEFQCLTFSLFYNNIAKANSREAKP